MIYAPIICSFVAHARHEPQYLVSRLYTPPENIGPLGTGWLKI
jgi:hypothetical protein